MIPDPADPPSSLRRQIETKLRPGERLLWAGQPDPGALFQATDIVIMPLNLFRLVLAVVLIAVSIVAGSGIFVVFGVAALLISVYAVGGRIVVLGLARKRTYYAVTDRRVVIVTTLMGEKVQSLPLDELAMVDLAPGSDGKGTIRFGANLGAINRRLLLGPMADSSRTSSELAFWHIDNAVQVKDIIVGQQMRLRQERLAARSKTDDAERPFW